MDSVSFSVNDGEIASVIGRNGSGKSTLLSIIASALNPDPQSGEVLFGGISAFEDPATRKKIGFAAQNDSLFDDLSVKDNIKFWAAAAKMRLKNITDNYFVRLFDLESFQSKRINALSGGMKRRVAICIALINDPSWIILDEPFTGLDLFYKGELIGYLKKLKAIGKTIIYTSHSADEIMRLSDCIYVINDGKITFSASTKEIGAYGNDLNEVLLKLI